MIAALTCSFVQPGCACLINAATPATCGAAIEVPPIETPKFPLPISAAKMATPGAVISGFSLESNPRGPRDENVAIVSAGSGEIKDVTFESGPTVIVLLTRAFSITASL